MNSPCRRIEKGIEKGGSRKDRERGRSSFRILFGSSRCWQLDKKACRGLDLSSWNTSSTCTLKNFQKASIWPRAMIFRAWLPRAGRSKRRWRSLETSPRNSSKQDPRLTMQPRIICPRRSIISIIRLSSRRDGTARWLPLSRSEKGDAALFVVQKAPGGSPGTPGVVTHSRTHAMRFNAPRSLRRKSSHRRPRGVPQLPPAAFCQIYLGTVFHAAPAAKSSSDTPRAAASLTATDNVGSRSSCSSWDR